MADARVAQQIAFLMEADRLKSILRQTTLIDASRQENSAEHSWHLVLAAVVLREHAESPVDVLRVLELLAVHDLVEIDAGDTFAYDVAHRETQAAREQAAAERIFGLLPPDQAAHFRARWEEFEGHETIESKFANAMDRLQPLLQNSGSGGGSWTTHNITRDAVLARMAPIRTATPGLWTAVVDVVETFYAAGVLR